MRFRKNSFTTPLSVDDATDAVEKLLDEKFKVFWISFRKYTGSINRNKFTIGSGTAHGFLIPSIQGSIGMENQTIVEVRFIVPNVIVFFYLIFPFTFLPAAMFMDEMTINGVLRAPSMLERISFALMGVVIPGAIFYVSFIIPLIKIETRLKEALRLISYGRTGGSPL